MQFTIVTLLAIATAAMAAPVAQPQLDGFSDLLEEIVGLPLGIAKAGVKGTLGIAKAGLGATADVANFGLKGTTAIAKAGVGAVSGVANGALGATEDVLGGLGGYGYGPRPAMAAGPVVAVAAPVY